MEVSRYATKQDLERHKNEIRRLYLDENVTGLAIRNYLEEKYQLHVTVNVWKKQIGQWSFDVKNNKAAMMGHAIQCYQQWLDEGKDPARFRHTAPNHKAVTADELTRYYSRKGLQLVDGELVSKILTATGPAALNAASLSRSATTEALAASVSEDGLSTVQHSIPHATAQHKDVVRHTDIPGQTRRDLGFSLLFCGRQSDRQRLLKARRAYLRRQRFVIPANLAAPECFRVPETALLAFEHCIKSSWGGNLWSVDDEGDYITSQKLGASGRCWEFDLMFVEAYELHSKAPRTHQARKMLLSGLSAVPVALQLCFPAAMARLCDFVIAGMKGLGAEYVRFVVRCCSNVLNCLGAANTDLRSLFAALARADTFTLEHLALQALMLSGNCLAVLDHRLFSKCVVMRVAAIRCDSSLDGASKVNSIASLLTEVRSISDCDLHLEFKVVNDLAASHYFDADQPDEAQILIKEGLGLVDLLTDCSSASAVLAADLLELLANIQWDKGDVLDAIRSAERSVDIQETHQLFDRYHHVIHQLASMKEYTNELEEAQLYRKKYEGLLDDFAEMNFEDGCHDAVEAALDVVEIDISSAELLADYAEGAPEDSGSSIGSEGQTSGRADEAYQSQQVESIQNTWQEKVTQHTQEALALPVMSCGLDADML